MTFIVRRTGAPYCTRYRNFFDLLQVFIAASLRDKQREDWRRDVQMLLDDLLHDPNIVAVVAI